MIALLLLAAAPVATSSADPLAADRTARAITAQLGAPPFEIWVVDQIRVARDVDPAVLKALAPDHSLDAVGVRLKALGVPFVRSRAEIAADRLPEQAKAEIAGFPPGEPFVLPEAQFISINVILGKRLPPNSVRQMPIHAPLRDLTREA